MVQISCPFILGCFASFLVSSTLAREPAPGVAPAAKTAPATPAAVSAMCKDGTAFNDTTLKGECRGHGGVDKWLLDGSFDGGTSRAVT